MNKQMFFTGIALIGVQILAIIAYLLTTLSYEWITVNFVYGFILVLVASSINVLAIVLIIKGMNEDGN